MDLTDIPVYSRALHVWLQQDLIKMTGLYTEST